MALMDDSRVSGRLADRRVLVQSTLINLASIMVGTVCAALVLRFQMALGWDFVGAVVLVLAGIFAFVLSLLPGYPHPRFGSANMVTAFRAALVSLTSAVIFCFDGLRHADCVLWAMVGVVVFALALDGVDGYLARRYRQESTLGARFDMEVDAVLILVLSVAAAMLDKAGSWVLLIGLMRYGFIALGRVVPVLAGELPPSLRRKAICVQQVMTLCLVLVPALVSPISDWLAAIALACLLLSFAIDTINLLRKPQQAG